MADVDLSASIGEMAGALVLAIGLCSGHRRQAFGVTSCQRRRGDSNRAGTPGKLKPNAWAAGEFRFETGISSAGGELWH